MNLDDSKSSPLESIPSRVLKDIIDIISPKIVIDFNSSIKTGIFPQCLKLSDLCPIFKKDIKLSKGNYRPVSLLAAISKIFEKLTFYQTREYMKHKLSIFLCAFRKGMNAQNCLVYMIEKWRKALDKSNKCGILLTDLSKAFDCLLHDLLIAKLHAYGFDFPSLRLINNYLTDRKQRVRVNGSYSNWSNIDFWVPQGSILRPE